MQNPILAETVQQIENTLGEGLNQLTVERAVLGLFFSGVKLSNGSGGLCFTPLKAIPEAVCCPSSAQAMPLSGKLTQRTVCQYLDDLYHENALRKTLAIATLNALSAACWQVQPPKNYALNVGKDAFDEAVLPKKGKTVVVGALVPILRRLIKEKCDFKVLEMDKNTLKGQELKYYAPAEDAHKYVPNADLLVITGVTLLNDTLPNLLAMAKPNAEIIVTGPTASGLPEAFFKRGVSVLGGVLVTKPDEVLNIISEGGSGYHFFGKSAERLIIKK